MNGPRLTQAAEATASITSAIDVAARNHTTPATQQPNGGDGGTALTIADLYQQPPLMPVWPTFGRDILGLSESGTYQHLAEGRLPVEPVRVGRRHMVRTADVLTWLHLPTNDDSAGVASPTPSVEHITETASQQIGRVP